jgi:hypothetical protein
MWAAMILRLVVHTLRFFVQSVPVLANSTVQVVFPLNTLNFTK